MCATCNEPISHAFSFSYANYFVKQRSVLEAMPVEWQRRFVALIEELAATVDLEQIPNEFWIRATKGKRFLEDPWSDYRHGPAVPMKAIKVVSDS